MPSFHDLSMEVPIKKWQIWEWEEHSEMISGPYATFETLQECWNYVRSEIERLHHEVGEDTLPYDQFPQENNVIHPIPDESTETTEISIASALNGQEVLYGWVVYLTGCQPSD